MPRFDGRVDFHHVDRAARAISTQLAQTPQGLSVGPFSQFRHNATMRAVVVFPVPRWPEKI